MPENNISNIAAHLPVMAGTNPHTPAVICPTKTDAYGNYSYVHYTLSQLNRQSDILASALEKVNIEKGVRTVLMVKPSLDFFALTFALFKVGAVPILIDPGIGVKKLKPSIREAEPEAFIGIPRAQLARILLGWGKETIRTSITVGRKFGWGGYTLDELYEMGKDIKEYSMPEIKPDDMAAILFTSGSTGPSKGVIYTHRVFNRQIELLKQVYNIQPGEKDFATFPLFALFGPTLGMTAIIPDMDASCPAKSDPEKLFKTIHDFGPTNMFASPALINLLSKYGEKQKLKIESLKRVISAGAPANPESLERFSNLLRSGIEIFTPYGATEALPVCNIGSKEILEETGKLTRQGKGACVGFPVDGITLKIIRISDDPIEKWSDELELPVNEIGEIVVKGKNVTAGYYNRPDSNRVSKIADMQNGGFYHRMGDVGYKDENARVWFCGRKSHRVVTESKTLFTIPTEALFNNHSEVFRTAIVGPVKNKKVYPVLCVEKEKNTKIEDTTLKNELREIARKNGLEDDIKDILFHRSFPVDVRHNAKIFREELTQWAQAKIR
ncbi:MAG: fatty acid CoA ligase family protein [Vulcanimicrobiota bacterium]